MRERLRPLWTAAAVLVPIASGVAWWCAGHAVAGGAGVLTGAVNGALLLRRYIPRRIPAYPPPRRRRPLVVRALRFPGTGE